MGYTNFLLGNVDGSPSNLPRALADLEDASLVFKNRWSRGDHQRAGETTGGAMQALDFIANEFLRVVTDREGAGIHLGSRFESELTSNCGRGVTGAKRADYLALVQAGAGNGHLPPHLGEARPLALKRLLNKIKHRNPHWMNFRIADGRHIFLICVDKTDGPPEGIYEFDVVDFCDHCNRALAAF